MSFFEKNGRSFRRLHLSGNRAFYRLSLICFEIYLLAAFGTFLTPSIKMEFHHPVEALCRKPAQKLWMMYLAIQKQRRLLLVHACLRHF